MRFLQNYPHFLEITYHGVERMLTPFRRWLVPGGFTERLFINLEIITKGPVFDCQMCGQCVLHSTGMTCPMTCPKTLRNGPCGGVGADGSCEVKPEMTCVWVEAWQRSAKLADYQRDMINIQAPLNNRLKDTSAWINEMNPDIRLHPKGWKA